MFAKITFGCIGALLVAVIVATFLHNLPYWCAHVDAPNSGNWLPAALGMCPAKGL